MRTRTKTHIRKGILAIVVALAPACDSGREGALNLEATPQELSASATVDIDRVLGFEATTVTDWSIIQSGPGHLSVSTTRSQGSRSLAVTTNGYAPVQSTALSSLGTRVGSVIHYDIMLPSNLPTISPWWYGTTQFFVEIPSLQVNSFLGQRELTGLPVGVWNTLTFTPSGALINKLKQTYSDLKVTIVVNAPYNATQPYLLDNLRFSNSTLALVTVVDGAYVPIPGATVVAYDGSTPTSYTGVTDANGVAKIWVPVGNYRFGMTEAGVTTYSSATNECHVPGACVGATIVAKCHAVTCTPSTECRVSTCQPADGTCHETIAPDGASCNDGDSCTAGDTCGSGLCLPGTPTTCAVRSKRKSNTQIVVPNQSNFGDIDGDGNDDTLVSRGRWVYVARNDFEGHGIVATRLDTFADISRLVIGNFTDVAGVAAAREEICAILSDNWLTCWTLGTNDSRLTWLSGTWSPIATDEEIIVGDYDGDGHDDLFVYKPSTGAMRLYVMDAATHTFVTMANYSLGNLGTTSCNRINTQVRAGDFGGAVGRDDVVLADTATGQICLFISATDASTRTFWWAFTSAGGVIGGNDDFAIASIDGDSRDDLVLRDRTSGGWRFRKLEFGGGSLVPITNPDVGQLPTDPNAQMFWMRNRGAFDPGWNRDDSMVYVTTSQLWHQTHARFTGTAETFWWAYTQNRLDLTADQDGDGIRTMHELGGYDGNGDGFSDEALQTRGAAAFARDIFVHMDYMAHDPNEVDNLALRNAAINRAVADMAAFDINLHVVTGAEVTWQKVLGGANPMNWATDFDPIKNANFPAAREHFYHYLLSAESYRGGDGKVGSSGISRGIPATDYIVSLGSWGSNGTDDQQAGTLLHELGHNLNFQHGGNDGVNYKPNFVSIMNYSYQMSGIRRDGTLRLFFSDIETESLDENHLNENRGVVITTGPTNTYETLFNGTWHNLGRPANLVWIDWNNDTVHDVNLALNLNDDGDPATPETLDVLTGSPNEYNGMHFTYTGSRISPAPIEPAIMLAEEAVPDKAEIERIRRTGPKVSTLQPARMTQRSEEINPPLYPELAETEYVTRIKPLHAKETPFDYSAYRHPGPTYQTLKLDPSKGPTKP